MNHDCPAGHGPMTYVPAAMLHDSVAWCGQWFACPRPGCLNTALEPSNLLRVHLADQATAIAEAKAGAR